MASKNAPNDRRPSDAAREPFPVRDPFAWVLRSTISKFLGLLAMSMIVSALKAVLSIFDVGPGLGELVTALLWGIGIYVLTRLFRGDLESDAPRPWWRMTGRPTAAILLGLYFLLSAVSPFVWPGGGLHHLAAVPYAALAALYLATAWILARTDGFRRPTPPGPDGRPQ